MKIDKNDPAIRFFANQQVLSRELAVRTSLDIFGYRQFLASGEKPSGKWAASLVDKIEAYLRSYLELAKPRISQSVSEKNIEEKAASFLQRIIKEPNATLSYIYYSLLEEGMNFVNSV